MLHGRLVELTEESLLKSGRDSEHVVAILIGRDEQTGDGYVIHSAHVHCKPDCLSRNGAQKTRAKSQLLGSGPRSLRELWMHEDTRHNSADERPER